MPLNTSWRLVEPLNSERDLVKSGPQAPLGTFSAKIDGAQQLGLISRYFARDLHLVRKIRNEFAHHPLELTFEVSPIRDWVSALEEASDHNRRSPATRAAIGPEGVRWDFLGIASWMLYHLQAELDGIQRLSEPGPEFGYVRWEELPAQIREHLEVCGPE